MRDAGAWAAGHAAAVRAGVLGRAWEQAHAEESWARVGAGRRGEEKEGACLRAEPRRGEEVGRREREGAVGPAWKWVGPAGLRVGFGFLSFFFSFSFSNSLKLSI